jgi:hypothetical protein
MTSSFASAMALSATTWNGAVSLSTPDPSGKKSGRLGLYFKSVRGLNTPRLHQYIREAAQESLIDAFLLAFHIRDCRGGKGERDMGRKAFTWLFLNHPTEFTKIVPLLAEYGRWDDLLQLFPDVLDLSDLDLTRRNYDANIPDETELVYIRDLQQNIVQLFAQQLRTDLANMDKGDPVSIAAKWAPTEGDSLDRKHNTVRYLSGELGTSLREYRKEVIGPLRTHLCIVEKFMCSRDWNSIEFSKVPSCAMKRLKKAFEKHTPDTFKAWKIKLQKGDVSVNAKQLFPHELIHEIRTKHASDEVCESQWRVLEEEVKKLGKLSDALVMVDSSGSMMYNLGNRNVLPIDVSLAMGIIVSNAVEGPFHNHILSFSNKPEFVVLKNGSLHDRYKTLVNMSWSMNTNLQAAFDLILRRACACKLNQEDMPKRLFIISDMQFDVACSTSTNFQVIKRKYVTAGYKLPQIVFWNVVGSSSDFPVTFDDNGTAMISGFSPSIMKAILESGDFTPYSILRSTLDGERYKPVRNALETLSV